MTRTLTVVDYGLQWSRVANRNKQWTVDEWTGVILKVFSASRGGEYGDCGVGAELGYVLVLWKQQETTENYGHTKQKKEKRRPRTREANELETRLVELSSC